MTIEIPSIHSAKTKKPKVTPKSIFEQVKADPKFTQARSIDWFKRKIAEFGGNSPSTKNELFKTTQDKQTLRVLPGSMYIFKYSPKTAEDLPYYDAFPCSLMFSITDTGFIGINFHYLSYEVRGKLFDKLWLIAQRYHNNKQQVLRLNWKLLSSVSKFPEVRPAVKQYLYSHLQSKLIRIDVEDWKTAMLLPVDSFHKKSQSYVARDSGQKIRRIISR